MSKCRVALAVFACAAVLVPSFPTAAEVAPGQDELGDIGGLESEIISGALELARPFSLAAAGEPPAAKVRIALVSSGVDVSALPEQAASKVVALLGNSGDPVGYGTHAASILLQALPGVEITSIGIYPGGRFNPSWQAGALQYIAVRPGEFDAVLYALPPHEFLDPISAAMAKGEWDLMSEALSDLALEGSAGQPTYGLALSSQLRAKQTAGRPYYQRVAIERFAHVIRGWQQATAQIDMITSAGVPVVVPAGDLGPNPQTIFGLANLPAVITVGGYDGTGVSARSSAGPAIDGTVKPDLVAPTGVPGVLPASSSLAKVLAARDLLLPDLKLQWQFEQPPSAARTRLDSTISAASVVAAAAGGMAAGGIDDLSGQKGALTAASVPLEGQPVTRQGAGLLRRLPDAEFAASRPLALSHASFGPEPDQGTWDAEIGFTSAPDQAVAVTDYHVTAGPDGRNRVASGEFADPPPVEVSVSETGVKLSLPLGDYSYRGGLWCGYTEVMLPATGGSVDPTVDVYGIPVDTEQVPHCLIKGERLTAKGFYIHDTDAANLTFGLLPAIPAGQHLTDHVLMLLPLNPLSTKLFFKVTKPYTAEQEPRFGAGTYAYFPNVPPGYYKVRQWSDYGAPITQTATDSEGNAVTVNDRPLSGHRDIGEKAAYQSFDALILGAVCSDPTGDQQPELYGENGAGSPCTRRWLEQSGMSFKQDKPTGGYFVDPTGDPDPKKATTIRVIFDFLKKMPGAGVASRYIDLLECGDLNFGTLDVNALLEAGLSASEMLAAVGSQPIDACNKTQTSSVDSGGVLSGALGPSSLEPAPPAGPDSLVLSSGIAYYPFNLPSPNYKAHMSVNFRYDVTNAYVVAATVVGNDVNWGVVTPSGQFQPASSIPKTPLNLSGLNQPWGQASGEASFDFQMLPRGASTGWLIFVVVPPSNSTIASALLDDISFELDTWTNVSWPATTFDSCPPEGDPCGGHSFQVSSNMNRDPVKAGPQPVYQIQDPPRCRRQEISGADTAAQICEDWMMMVHSPGDDAATFDVVDAAGGSGSILADMKEAGAQFFDPVRGVNDFSHTLVIPHLSVAAFELSAQVPFEFKTDGSHWEQLTLPLEVNRKYQGAVEFRIADNLPGRLSTLFEHTVRQGEVTGAVQVAPYVPFKPTALFLNPPL